MKRLNKNNTPFLILLVVHAIILFITIQKKGIRKTLQSLLPNIGIAYLFEYFVLNLFHAYTYYPKFIRNKYLDNVFGAILSQAVFVPITATYLSLFKLGWRYKLFFTAYFFIVEHLFLRLKIYRHQWWDALYTSILLPVFFKISDIVIKSIRNQNPMTLSRYLTFVVIHVNWLFLLALKNKFRFGYKTFNWDEHFILTPLYSLWVSVLYTINDKKKGLSQSLITISSLLFTDFLLKQGGLLQIPNWKKTFLPVHLTLFSLGGMVKKLFTAKEKR
ncbi:hypothetical protein J2S74_001385 [Evansella vedderi]|uniref:Uncharacterized protein n=1 Tax=Evansella vedderi TaxID=38282 RepID=A0ABT9ZS03_9BACI|nr:hypothetical protein [Evansella vedderi]MDQ0254012.1 hypothetical protein [Evansella vedderi]